MHCHVGWVMLCSLLPAMSGQFELFAQRPGNGGCWCEHGQGDQTSCGWTDSKSLTVVSFCSSAPSSFALCVGVLIFVRVFVFSVGLKSQHQTLTSQSRRAGERRRCQDAQHQKVSPMSLLVLSYLQKSLCILKWLLMNGWCFWPATFHRQLWMRRHWWRNGAQHIEFHNKMTTLLI